MKKKKKRVIKFKGFTLVELISVIVIMGILLIIAIPGVFGVEKNIKDNMYCAKIRDLEEAAKLYGQDYVDEINQTGFLEVDVKTLIENNLYKKENDSCIYDTDDNHDNDDNACVKDPRNDYSMDGEKFTVVNKGNRFSAYYTYLYDEDRKLCEGKKEKDIYGSVDVNLLSNDATSHGKQKVNVTYLHDLPKLENADMPKKEFVVNFIADNNICDARCRETIKPITKKYTFQGYFYTVNGETQYYNANGTSAHIYDIVADYHYLNARFSNEKVTIKPIDESVINPDYYFVGWGTTNNDESSLKIGKDSTDIDLNKYINPKVSNTLNLYAFFRRKAVKVSFDNNGATYAAKDSIMANYGQKLEDITIPKKEFNVTFNANGGTLPYNQSVLTSRYKFNGYCESKTTCGTKYYEDNGKSNYVSYLTAPTTIYAQWSDGGVTLPTATKSGYKLAGWYTKTSYGSRAGDAGQPYYPSSDITLYAQWKVDYDGRLESGYSFNSDLKALANNGQSIGAFGTDKNIIAIRKSNTPPPSGVATKNVADYYSEMPITAWFDKGTIYLYSPNGKLIMNSSSSNMFSYMESLKNIDLNIFDTSNVTDMSRMFYGDSSIVSLDLSHFNTSKVTNMSYMFGVMKNIKTIDVSHFDTSKVKNMSNMFVWNTIWIKPDEHSNALTTIKGLENFNTSSVTDMNSMFQGLARLQSLNLSSFDTSNVTDMSWMFCGDNSLTSLDLRNFNTSKVTDMSWMFERLTQATSLNISSFDTSKVTDMSGMFGDDNKLSSLDVSHFNTSKVTNMKNMFIECKSLSNLDVSHFDTSNVTNMTGMFSWMENVRALDVSHFNTSKVTDMSGMFNSCKKLSSINISGFDTSNVTSMAGMFSEIGVSSLDVSHFNTSKVTDMEGMFSGLKNVTSLNLLNFDTSNVKYMGSMFDESTKITELDLRSFDTRNVVSTTADTFTVGYAWGKGIFYNGMFSGMSSLTRIYVSDKWNMSNVKDSYQMFSGSTRLVGGAGTKYSSSHTEVDYAHIDGVGGPGYLTRR